ncbi:MAG: hypothetical protein KY437_01785 [Actinobacteria bacterium]|nr:hypothetical protein [Actinomycetota bacterium]
MSRDLMFADEPHALVRDVYANLATPEGPATVLYRDGALCLRRSSRTPRRGRVECPGALAERVFAHRIRKIGSTDPVVHGRRRFSIDAAARYPLFSDELIALMRELLRPEQHDRVATAITLTAWKPASHEQGTT